MQSKGKFSFGILTRSSCSTNFFQSFSWGMGVFGGVWFCGMLSKVTQREECPAFTPWLAVNVITSGTETGGWRRLLIFAFRRVLSAPYGCDGECRIIFFFFAFFLLLLSGVSILSWISTAGLLGVSALRTPLHPVFTLSVSLQPILYLLPASSPPSSDICFVPRWHPVLTCSLIILHVLLKLFL